MVMGIGMGRGVIETIFLDWKGVVMRCFAGRGLLAIAVRVVVGMGITQNAAGEQWNRSARR